MLFRSTVGYRAVRDNVWVERMLSGVRCVVAPVIVSAVGKLCRGAFPQRACLPLGVLAFAASALFHVNNVLLILCGIAAGLLLGHTGRGGDGQ